MAEEQRLVWVMQRDRNDPSQSAWLKEDPTLHQKVHQLNQLSSRQFSAVLKSWSKSSSWIFLLPGASVIQVMATDADDATYGNSAKVVYSILEGQPYFSVDPETGQCQVKCKIYSYMWWTVYSCLHFVVYFFQTLILLHQVHCTAL